MAKKTNTRRGNNEGSIFQRKDGRWVATVTLGYDDNGKRNRRSTAYFGIEKIEK